MTANITHTSFSPGTLKLHWLSFQYQVACLLVVSLHDNPSECEDGHICGHLSMKIWHHKSVIHCIIWSITCTPQCPIPSSLKSTAGDTIPNPFMINLNSNCPSGLCDHLFQNSTKLTVVSSMMLDQIGWMQVDSPVCQSVVFLQCPFILYSNSKMCTLSKAACQINCNCNESSSLPSAVCTWSGTSHYWIVLTVMCHCPEQDRVPSLTHNVSPCP